MRFSRIFIPSAAVLIALSGAVGPRAEACTPITSVPYTISTGGTYCLTQDLSYAASSGSAITIGAGWVTLDLGGYTLSGLPSPSSTAIGISSTNVGHVTVRRGRVDGFYRGVYLTDYSGQANSNVVEDIQALNSFFSGITVGGRYGVVRGNKVLGTGGASGSTSSFGISVFGDFNTVIDNEVLGFATTTFYNYGVFANPSNYAVIKSNRIGGARYGVYVQNSASVLVVGNEINQGTNGVFYWVSSGKYRDNLTSGVTTPYQGGTDAGNNQ